MTGVPRRGYPLTGRERHVLQRAALGDDRTATARELGISVHTVNAHRRNAVAKLGARSFINAVVLAAEAGLIHPHPCGEVRTYHWHLRHGEHPDADCREAEAQRYRKWSAARMDQTGPEESILVPSDSTEPR